MRDRLSDLFTKSSVERLQDDHHPVVDLVKGQNHAAAFETGSALRRLKYTSPEWFSVQQALLTDPSERTNAAQRLAYLRSAGNMLGCRFDIEHMDTPHRLPMNFRARHAGSVLDIHVVGGVVESDGGAEMRPLTESSFERVPLHEVAAKMLGEMIDGFPVRRENVPLVVWLDFFHDGSWRPAYSPADLSPFYSFANAGKFGTGAIWSGLYARAGDAVLHLGRSGYLRSPAIRDGVFNGHDARQSVAAVSAVVGCFPETAALLDNPFAARPIQKKVHAALLPLVDPMISRAVHLEDDLPRRLEMDRGRARLSVTGFMANHAETFGMVHGLANPDLPSLRLPSWTEIMSGDRREIDHLGELSLSDPAALGRLKETVVACMNTGEGFVSFQPTELAGSLAERTRLETTVAYLRRILRNASEPACETLAVASVEGSDSQALIVAVPEQPSRPYQLVSDGTFPRRGAGGIELIRVDELRDMIVSAAMFERDVETLVRTQADLVRRTLRWGEQPTLRAAVIPRFAYKIRRNPGLVPLPSLRLVRPDLDDARRPIGARGFSHLVGEGKDQMYIHVSDDWSLYSAVLSPLSELGFGDIDVDSLRTSLYGFFSSIQEMYDRVGIVGPHAVQVGLHDLKSPSLANAFRHATDISLPHPRMVDRLDGVGLVEDFLQMVYKASRRPI